MVNSNMCEECNLEETIEHYLFYCKPVMFFYILFKVEHWMEWKSNQPCDPDRKNYNFGLYYDITHMAIYDSDCYLFSPIFALNVLSVRTTFLYASFHMSLQHQGEQGKIIFQK